MTPTMRGATLEAMAEQTFWTDARRRILGKTLFDVFKLELAAIFASKFFVEFAPPVKWIMAAVTLATLVVALVVFPAEDGE